MSSPLRFPDTAGVYPVDSGSIGLLVQQARERGRNLIRIDLSAARDKAAILAALADGLGLPESFGANLDALYDCLTDADFAPEGVVLLEGLHDVPGLRTDDLLEVFTDAADQPSLALPVVCVFWTT